MPIGSVALPSASLAVSGRLLADAQVVQGVSTTARLVSEVSTSTGTLLDQSIFAVDGMAFRAWLPTARTGDALSIRVFLDTNGNRTADTGEASGTVTYTLAGTTADAALRVQLK